MKRTLTMFFELLLSSIKRLHNTMTKAAVKYKLVEEILSKNIFIKFAYITGEIDFKRKLSECKTIQDYISLALNYQYSLIKALPPMIVITTLQRKREITEFCKMIRHVKAKTILEIGTANGGTLFLLTRFSDKHSLVITMDLPESLFFRGFDFKIRRFYKSFASNHQKVELINGDSHELSTLKKLKKVLKDRELDILFIDGDHSYEGVKKDFEMYSPLVRKGGLIVFHDIVVVPPEIEKNNGVNKFWNEIKRNHEFKEIVDDWNQGWGGIGIIWKN